MTSGHWNANYQCKRCPLDNRQDSASKNQEDARVAVKTYFWLPGFDARRMFGFETFQQDNPSPQPGTKLQHDMFGPEAGFSAET